MVNQDSRTIELDDLIDRYCAGIITESDFSRLHELLANDERMRARYREMTQVHAALYEAVDVNSFANLNQEVQSLVKDDSDAISNTHLVVSTKHLWGGAFALAGSTLLVIAFSLYAWDSRTRQARKQHSELVERIVGNEKSTDRHGDRLISTPVSRITGLNDQVAELRSSANAVWAKQHGEVRTGQTFSTGTIRLEAGVAELAVVSGAVIVLEGPATLELMSPLRGRLLRGKVRCFVPERVKGFSIETAATQYSELGSEFGLEAFGDRREELHVFDGEVAVSSLSRVGATHLVSSGSGLRNSGDDLWTKIDSDSKRFADSIQVRERRQQQSVERHQEWNDYINDIRECPDLVLLYDFQQEPSRPTQLLDKSKEQQHGGIIGCAWSEGRWEGKSSLEFKRPNDRVRMNIPGSFENMTLSTWLRVDGFDREFNSIMLTDKFEQGDLHWQIKSNGTIDAGVKVVPNERQVISLSPPVFTFNDLGRWMHLVLVVDQDAGFVSHYCNGKFVSRQSLGREGVKFSLDLGATELGNWSPKKQYDDWPIRNFNGRIDEFMVFSRAFSHDEITTMFTAGNPCR